jgi:hypothetical protein
MIRRMDLHARRKSEGIAAMAVVVLSIGIALYGLYLVVVGTEWTIVEAVPLGDSPGVGASRYLPAIQGLLPLVGGAMVVVGVAVNRPLLAWVGTVVVAVFSALFLFGVGGILIPFAAALLALLAVLTLLHHRRRVDDRRGARRSMTRRPTP